MIKQFFLYLFILFLTLNSASALNNDDDVLIPKVYKKIHPDLPDRLPDLNSGYNIYGFVNKNGKWIIEGKVSNYDKSVVFRKGGEISAENFPDFNWGIIDSNGSWVIEPKYVYPLIIKEGLIAACTGVKECGYIDKKNKWVIKPQFDTALDFSEGIAIVKKDGKWGFINKKGSWVLAPGSIPDTVIFEDGISDIRGHLIKSKGAEFKHGLAPVEIVEYRIKIGKEEYEAQFPSGYNIVNRKRVKGRIEVNSSGRKKFIVVEDPDNYLKEHFCFLNTGIIVENYKPAYINKKGEILYNP